MADIINIVFNKIITELWKPMLRSLIEDLPSRHHDEALFTNGVFIFQIEIREAGVYDGSVDGVGMPIGEGWIGYGWPEYTLKIQDYGDYMPVSEIKDYLKTHHDGRNAINWNWDIQVCSSGGGYYIGMVDPEDGQPYALSTQYYEDYDKAWMALATGTFAPKLWF